MELIQMITKEWYWLIDMQGVGYHQSIKYEAKEEAVRAALYGKIEWEV